MKVRTDVRNDDRMLSYMVVTYAGKCIHVILSLSLSLSISYRLIPKGPYNQSFEPYTEWDFKSKE